MRPIGRLLLCVVLLMSLPAWAEEAVISEEVKPLSGYDKGFFIRTADDEFKLKINGRLQPRYRYENIRNVRDINTFEVRRSQVVFTATLFKHFDVQALIQHGTVGASRTTVNTPGGGTTQVNNVVPYWWAEAAYQPIPEFGLTVGMIQLPMDRQGESSSGSRGLIEQPITATQDDGQKGKTIARQSFGLPSTIGIRLGGDVGRFHYAVALGNGEDEHSRNATKEMAFAGRFVVDALGDPGFSEMDLAYSETPKLQFGIGSGFEGADATDANINNVNLNWSWTSSADAAFKWRGLTLITEWYMRKLKVSTGNFTLDDVGYYAHAGYFILPKKLELAVRGAQMFREGPDNNAYEFSGGVNWYIHGNNVKLQTDFTRLLDFDETEGQGNRPFNRFRTMLTFNI